LTGAREGNQATRVLVVDDHPTNRMLLLRQMQALGYAAESAAEGAEALSLWQSGRFAMVITDCEMPGMDGYEFSTELRRLEAASGRPRVPIIACTAHALAGVAEKCFGAGMDDVIIKPMNLDQLARKLQQWLVPHDGDAAAAGVDVTDAPLDLAVISQRWGGAAAVHEVLATFRRCNQEDAARLRDAAGMGDVAQVKAMSHRMAGAAGMVGASDLASSCRRVEQAAEAGDSQEIHAGLAVFAREWARVAQYCEAAPAHAGGNGGLRHRAAIAAGHSPAWRTMDRPRVYPGSDGQEHDAFCLR
jgi:CheY-like chemotaxis protein/HPt (histidine-containing phosphotransfer) domain-containing protein